MCENSNLQCSFIFVGGIRNDEFLYVLIAVEGSFCAELGEMSIDSRCKTRFASALGILHKEKRRFADKEEK